MGVVRKAVGRRLRRGDPLAAAGRLLVRRQAEVGRRLRRGDRPPDDITQTREYWIEKAGGTVETAVDAICDGYGPAEFAEQSSPRLPILAELRGDMAVMDLCCGMGRTCRRVAPLVKEYHGVDFAEGMLSKAREYNANVPNAFFHANDGRTLGGFADHTLDLVYCELAYQHMPRGTQEAYTAEALRVLRGGGLFFVQLPRAEFYVGADNSLTGGDIRRLLSGFASAGGSIDETGQYWLARAAKRA